MTHSNTTRANRHEYCEGALGGFMKHAVGILFAACVLGASWERAEAQVPALTFEQGVLVSPSQAGAYYLSLPSGISSPEIRSDYDPRIVQLAAALEGDPYQIDAFIREHIETIPHFGLQKGGVGALLDRSGTAFDQAQLMVDVVRASAGQARYVYGTLSLSQVEFRAAFGLPASANLTDVLADGGVPAAVSGSVQFLHVWVEVNVDGLGWRVFDPSLKFQSWSAGQDVVSVSGISAHNIVSSLTAGVSRGSSSGQPWVEGISASPTAAELQRLSDNLKSELETEVDLIGVNLVDFVGGRSLSGEAFVDGSQSAHPHEVQKLSTWAGEIPLSFRTRLDVYTSNTGASTPFATLYLDDIYGGRITLGVFATDGAFTEDLNVDPNVDPTQFETRLYAGHVSLSQLDDRTSVRGWTQSNPADFLISSAVGAMDEDIRLMLDAPYAAEGGTYQDVEHTVTAYRTSLTEIFAGAGAVTRHHVAAYERGAATDAFRAHFENNFLVDVTDTRNQTEVIVSKQGSPEQWYWQHPTLRGLELSLDRDFYWRRWASQREHVSRVISALAGAEIRHHFSLGVVTGGGGANNPASLATRSHESAYTPVWIDAVTTASVSTYETGASIEAALTAYSSISSMLEASVIDLAFARTPAGSWESKALSAVLSGSGRHYAFAPGAFDGGVLSAQYPSQIVTRLQDYTGAGYSIVTPFAPTEAEGSRFAVFRQNGEEYALANLYMRDDFDSAGVRSALRKGGGADVTSTIRPPEVASPEVARDEAASGVSMGYQVSLRDGSFSYSPAPDVMAGGEGAHAIAFQRQYASTGGQGALGAGWTHNWDIKARVHNGASHLLDSDNPRLMAPTIAAVQMMLAVGESADLHEALILNGIITNTWYDNYANRSLLTVQAGSGESIFVKLSDGVYQNLSNNFATIEETQSGGDYSGTDFIYRDQDGAEIRFEAVTAAQLGGRIGNYLTDVYPATSWSLPTGVEYSLEYREKTGVLERVSNNFEWQLEFEAEEDVCSDAPGYVYRPGSEDSLNWDPSLSGACRALTNRFQLIDGVRASHMTTPGDYEEARYFYEGYSSNHLPYEVRLARAQTPATGNNHFRYGYDMGDVVSVSYAHVSGGGVINRGVYSPLLSEIYEPGQTQTPILKIEYDRNRRLLPDRVSDVSYLYSTDGSPQYEAFTYRSTGLGGAVIDPVGEESREYYDEENRLVRTLTPTLLQTTTQYDGLSRQTEVQVATSAAPDQYLARTTYAYDALNNLIEEIQHPRYGQSGAPLSVTRLYEDPNWPHKPTSVTDARGHTTQTEYYPTTGLVHRETGPSGEIVTYYYTADGLLERRTTRVEE